MTIRIHADQRLHRFDRPDTDRRLGWTRCGRRFEWGSVPRGNAKRERCPECFR